MLGSRLVEMREAAVGVKGKSAFDVFGSPDDLKLKSCATLFAAVSPAGSVFERVIEKYFGGARDEKTLRLLDSSPVAEDATGPLMTRRPPSDSLAHWTLGLWVAPVAAAAMWAAYLANPSQMSAPPGSARCGWR